MNEFETHDNFYLNECGICSGWTFNVTCKKTLKYGVIQISKCTDESKYTVFGTSLDENCDIDSRDYPSNKEDLMLYLSSHFLRVDHTDPCSSFHLEHPNCPTCGKDTISDENELS